MAPVIADVANLSLHEVMTELSAAVGVYERTGIEIPERDQAGLRTVEAFAAYLQATPSRRQ
jgi:hypothetical protein